MAAYNKRLDEVVKNLESDIDKGLSDVQVSEKREKFGLNKLQEKKKKTNFQRFIDQFKDVMIMILLAAAAISFAVAIIEQEAKEFFEPALILFIVVVNAILGVLQESKAEKALEALKDLSALHARVIRNGEEKMVDSTELVPGDIIKLEAGDFVPADGRLIKTASLKVDESALTGESVPSEKDSRVELNGTVAVGDRKNMIFSGCGVTYGTGVAIITGTGMDTEMGKIANLLDAEESDQTPLQKKLAELGKYLGILALAACGIIFAIGAINGLPIMELFMTAVSLAVSAIPEGLPAIVTIVLSIGVQRMVKKNAIIRRLPAVETLGSASIICSDKTGTLTQNQMTLVKAYVDGEGELEDISDNNSDNVRKLLTYSVLCSDGSIIMEEGKVKHIGDPTETSIILAAHNNGIYKDEINEKYTRLGEIPFDSDRKLMTSINEIEGKKIVIVKGAFDVLAKLTVEGDIEKAEKLNEEMSKKALRVLAVGYKEIEEIPEELTSQNIENNLTFMGLVGMIDPPRPEAKDAVAVCRRAGIKPVMITGDHVITASAIAKELDIFQEGDKAITGVELDDMTDREFDGMLKKISVYARVSPENKIRIVKAWQRQGQVVSMTGDGVNDAPALKAADIGCAMGITGTEVAKGAADMTLTDDNFATIVDAVREGRGIYSNIKKVVGFLLGTNIGEVFTVFFAMLLWHRTPLLSMQLLWINLVTDSLPAIALGMEAIESNVMDKKPKPKEEGIFANGYGIRIILQGGMFAILTLYAFKLGESVTGQLIGGQTMAFIVLAMSQVVQAFNMRSASSLFKIGPFSNKKLNLAVLISTALMALVVFTPVSVAFGLIYLPIELYLTGLGLSLVPLGVMELAKAVGLIKAEL
ncbi:cation-translocating P-type ATPase [Alkalibacter mobilis]|uniref:cation-translocating P-type ATPase n=1 Tax=Alkalibacter mobilis TaxID=2787712 RepID=UPI0018A035FE|nr:cation-translocating P-type ATPase [Alkalibacter mobilis]MBF7097792.1 cation-translocating P-type ATPase [Alkalibacter mobilis]